jgi:hypothetical protein
MKIKTIKDIITSQEVKNGNELHFIGEVESLIDWSECEGKKNGTVKRLIVREDNYCIPCYIRKGKIENYDEVVKNIDITALLYFEGKIKMCCDDTIEIDITNISSNVRMKQLEHEEQTAETVCLMHIWNGEENLALDIIENNKDMNVNFYYYSPLLIQAANRNMTKLAISIINHPNFNPNSDDGFGESLLHHMVLFFTNDEVQANESLCNHYKEIIIAILNNSKTDLNKKDIYNMTPICIACQFNSVWLTTILSERKDVDVNICDDIFGSLIENCIENESFEALKIITKRKDLNVSIDDLKMADEYGIDLSEYGIEIAKKLKKAHDYAFANS